MKVYLRLISGSKRKLPLDEIDSSFLPAINHVITIEDNFFVVDQVSWWPENNYWHPQLLLR